MKHLFLIYFFTSTCFINVSAQVKTQTNASQSIDKKQKSGLKLLFNNYSNKEITDKDDLEFLSLFTSQEEINPELDYMEIGGALRYSFVYTHYEGETFPLGTSYRNDFTWDTWRLNVNGRNNSVIFSFEYRFYPSFNSHFIHHGWIGYDFSEQTQMQLGVSQVPFGLLPFASHSWWFNLPYYAGLEDDYDIGIRFYHELPKFNFHLAYYPLAEPRGTSDPAFGAYASARYSYDVIPVEFNQNIERNQLNGRAEYQMNENLHLGISYQTSEIFNQTTSHTGSHRAIALHGKAVIDRWDFIAEYIYYNYNNVENDLGEELKVVQMGAYGFGDYQVAAEASIALAGVSYSIPLDWGPFDNISIYNDYSVMFKPGSLQLGEKTYGFEKSQQNVLGALISAGNIYTYVDLASGYNHPWLTNDFGGTDLGPGNPENFASDLNDENPVDDDAFWNTRLNVNIGYYF